MSPGFHSSVEKICIHLGYAAALLATSPLCPFPTHTSFHHIKQVLLSVYNCAVLTIMPTICENSLPNSAEGT